MIPSILNVQNSQMFREKEDLWLQRVEERCEGMGSAANCYANLLGVMKMFQI